MKQLRDSGVKGPETITKRPYQPPRLRTISLAADEVLGTGCKLSKTGMNGPLGQCITPSPCPTLDLS